MMRDDRRQGVPRRFGIIKISRGIHLQSHGKFMEMRCHLMVVVKVLNKVGLAVAIHVSQPRNLIAAANKQFPIAEFHPQWLKKPGRQTMPTQIAGSIHSVDPPDIAIPSVDGSVRVSTATAPSSAPTATVVVTS